MVSTPGGCEPKLAEVEPAELPDRIAEIIADWTRNVVAAASTADRHDTAVALAAEVLDLFIERFAIEGGVGSQLVPNLQRLLAVEALAPTGEPMAIARPLTPLRDTVLMTNARDQLTVGREIAGAPPLNVAFSEVGLKDSEVSRVGGGT